MTTTATQLMTAEEFFEWCQRPENRQRSFELDQGRVIEMSRPGVQHGYVCSNVGRILGNYTFQQGKGYVCGNDTGVIWERDPDTVKGPDVLYFAEQCRLNEMNPKWSEDPPRLAIEVLSPNDRMSKVNERISRFLRLGTRRVWLLEPEERTLTVYWPDAPLQVLHADAELVDDDLLPGFRCKVADFFFAPGEAKPTASAPSKP